MAGQAGAGQGVGAWSKLQQTHEQTRVRPLVKLQASAKKKYIYFNIIYIPLQVLGMCSPINYNKRGAPIGLMINMYRQHAHQLHFFMRMTNLAYRYYTLNFRCNSSAGAGDVRPLNEPQKTTKFENRRSPDVLHHVPGLVSGPRLKV